MTGADPTTAPRSDGPGNSAWQQLRRKMIEEGRN